MTETADLEHPPPAIDFEAVTELLDVLRRDEGLRIGPRERIAVDTLLTSLIAQGRVKEVHELRDFLAPVLARSPEERERFARAFARKFPPPVIAPVKPVDEAGEAPHEGPAPIEDKPKLRLVTPLTISLAALAVVLVAAIGGAIAMFWRPWQPGIEGLPIEAPIVSSVPTSTPMIRPPTSTSAASEIDMARRVSCVVEAAAPFAYAPTIRELSGALVDQLRGCERPDTGTPLTYIWPAKGRIVLNYGVETDAYLGTTTNEGVNLALPAGSEVRAAAAGAVGYVDTLDGMGNTILIQHSDGWVTAYAHLQEFRVKNGDTVARGQVIGLVGQTEAPGGRPQLHFELRRQGSGTPDPSAYLPAREFGLSSEALATSLSIGLAAPEDQPLGLFDPAELKRLVMLLTQIDPDHAGTSLVSPAIDPKLIQQINASVPSVIASDTDTGDLAELVQPRALAAVNRPALRLAREGLVSLYYDTWKPREGGAPSGGNLLFNVWALRSDSGTGEEKVVRYVGSVDPAQSANSPFKLTNVTGWIGSRIKNSSTSQSGFSNTTSTMSAGTVTLAESALSGALQPPKEYPKLLQQVWRIATGETRDVGEFQRGLALWNRTHDPDVVFDDPLDPSDDPPWLKDRPRPRRPPLWTPWLAALLPLVLAGLWVGNASERRKAYLRRRPPDTGAKIHELIADQEKGLHRRAETLRRAAQRLQAWSARETDRIDIGATVETSVQRQRFTPVRARLRAQPEYLVLIESRGASDQQALRLRNLVGQLQELHIQADIFYFSRQPEICHAEVARGGRILAPFAGEASPIEGLLSRFPRHRLLVLGDSGGFRDPATGEPMRGAATLRQWEARAMLTPRPLAEWGEREFSVVRMLDLPIGRATEEGLVELAQLLRLQGAIEGDQISFAGDGDASPLPSILSGGAARWTFDDPPEEAPWEDVRAALVRYLDPPAYDWLCACAVYPGVRWDLTFFLGVAVKTPLGETLYREDRLAALTQLPWFREGRMPDWLRERLIADLGDRGDAVRQVLQDLLGKADEEARAARPDAVTLQIATGGDDAFADQIFVDFLAKARTTDLEIKFLDVLKHLLPDRIIRNIDATALGLAGVGVAAALLAWLVAPRGGQISVFDTQNPIAGGLASGGWLALAWVLAMTVPALSILDASPVKGVWRRLGLSVGLAAGLAFATLLAGVVVVLQTMTFVLPALGVFGGPIWGVALSGVATAILIWRGARWFYARFASSRALPSPQWVVVLRIAFVAATAVFVAAAIAVVVIQGGYFGVFGFSSGGAIIPPLVSVALATVCLRGVRHLVWRYGPDRPELNRTRSLAWYIRGGSLFSAIAMVVAIAFGGPAVLMGGPYELATLALIAITATACQSVDWGRGMVRQAWTRTAAALDRWADAQALPALDAAMTDDPKPEALAPSPRSFASGKVHILGLAEDRAVAHRVRAALTDAGFDGSLMDPVPPDPKIGDNFLQAIPREGVVVAIALSKASLDTLDERIALVERNGLPVIRLTSGAASPANAAVDSKAWLGRGYDPTWLGDATKLAGNLREKVGRTPDAEQVLGWLSHLATFLKPSASFSARETQGRIREACVVFLAKNKEDRAAIFALLDQAFGKTVAESRTKQAVSSPAVLRAHIIFATQDGDRIDPIIQCLLDANIGVFMDNPSTLGVAFRYEVRRRIETIDAGVGWREQIEASLRSPGTIGVLILSSVSAGRLGDPSYMINQEVTAARETGRLLPVRIDNTPINEQVADLQVLDLRELMTGGPRAHEQQQRFLDALNRLKLKGHEDSDAL